MNKKYIKHFLFFGAYLTILLTCMSPDISQKCYGNDAFSFLYGAKFLEVRYPAPLYTFIGWPVSNLPFGIDGGNLVLFLSTIPAFLSSICVFLIVRKHTENKLAPWVGSAALMGCYVFFSQAIIVELYSLLSFFLISAFLAITYGKYKTAAILCGFAMSCHYVMGVFPFAVFLIYSKEFRKIFYLSLLVFGIIFFSYYYCLDRFVWELETTSSNQLFDIFNKVLKLFEKGSYDILGQTFWEGMSTIVISFGLAMAPIIMFMKNARRSYVFWIILSLPIGLILFGGYNRYIYIVPFAPFIAVMAGIGINHLTMKYLDKGVLVGSMLMMISMPLFFDIGNTVDERETTARQMIDDLNGIENGSVILGMRLFEGEDGKMYSDSLGGNVSVLVEYYNRDNDKAMIPVRISFLSNLKYVEQREELTRRGMVLPDRKDIVRKLGWTIEDWIKNIGQQIFLSNPDRDVYYYEVVDKETERCELVKVNLK